MRAIGAWILTLGLAVSPTIATGQTTGKSGEDAAPRANADTDPSQATTQADLQKQVDDLKKEVETPDALRFKGITISPTGSFIEAATVYRSSATGGGINTSPTGIPLEHSGQAETSEFFGSGRQTRLALKAIGKLADVEMNAYYELDWLGTGI